MSEEFRTNTGEVLNILMGYAQSDDVLKKSLWWITRNLKKPFNKVIIVDDGECGDIYKVIKNYAVRIQHQIIKIDNNKLKNIFNINSLNESKNLGFSICEKFSSDKKIFISPRTLCYNFNFDSFVQNINNNNIIKMQTYMVPKYVQNAMTEHSANFCNLLAKECKKFPLYTQEFPAKTDDFIVKSYIGNNENKEETFLDYDCFYLEPNIEIESDKIKNIDKNLIDLILA